MSTLKEEKKSSENAFCVPELFCVLSGSGLSVGDNRSRTALVKDFGSLEHVVQNGGLTGTCLVKHVTVQVNAALTDIMLADLYPVRLGTVYVAEEVVTDTLEILIFFVAVAVVVPVADIVPMGKNNGIDGTDDVLHIGNPFFVIIFQAFYAFIRNA